ncbi:hypothetical protein KUTeg_000025 [Tegillarca granosa]|uniref:Uncharacterized protein n=1 Tax=Tegillarca granosa TaxID=220873 RepID=A0ABQ9FYS3_TEGGR|nr:hypothetical protein KUTeg_000025 [Tegillarca granosa]
MEGSTQKRPVNFRIEIPGDGEFKQKIQNQFQRVKNYITANLNKKRIDNGVVMEQLLEFWLKNKMSQLNESEPPEVFPCLYKQVRRDQVNEPIFLTVGSSLSTFGELCTAHARKCKGTLKIQKTTEKGHVVALRLECEHERSHSYLWSSSPYLPNNEYLINYRVNHGFLCSGMLPVHYQRLCNGAGLRFISKERRKEFFNLYKGMVEIEFTESVSDALYEEIASYEELDGINIMTDARHGWRKNAKDTSVVALGENMHKVIQCVHVTKSEERVSQKHEYTGTLHIYNYLNEKDVDINIHIHDRNLSINKFIKDTRFTQNQNDLWHAVKQVKKALTNISSGAKIYEGVKWSSQIVDKIEPIATHIYWAVHNCEEKPEKLRFYLDNITEHYKNNHSQCHESSRCKQDSNYEPSRELIGAKAEKLLKSVIEKSTIYKYPQDYVLGKNTAYVESFNNVMNIFQDKRVAFGDEQYRFREQLACCHWNENVDRKYTSVWIPNNPNAPRNQKGKKVYAKCTYEYRLNVWNHLVDRLY